jgi:hypothetical protein
VAKRYKEYVPAEPFGRWLQVRFEFHRYRLALPGDDAGASMGAHRALADELGWNGDGGVRKLYRYRHMRKETARGSRRNGTRVGVVFDQTHFPRCEVEEALHFAGVSFWELYPEIAAAEDVPLEPEMVCWECKDLVTPINGLCPWCVGRREFEAQEKERIEDRQRNRLYRERWLRERRAA